MDLDGTIAAYGAAWNEADGGARRALLEQAWAAGGLYCDPLARVEGRDALDAHIAGFAERRPGARIDITSGVDEHDGWFRFTWALVAGDGSALGDGFDVGHLDADDRIDLIVGFFGPFPAK